MPVAQYNKTPTFLKTAGNERHNKLGADQAHFINLKLQWSTKKIDKYKVTIIFPYRIRIEFLRDYIKQSCLLNLCDLFNFVLLV